MKHTLKNGQEIYMDSYLMTQLDSLVYNLKSDWDFVIVITGDRMVRTGKSVLAMQVCSYLADRIGSPYDESNIFFDSSDMINAAQEMPKNSIIHYDEGREGLAANKASNILQKDLLDYFAECGQLNHIFVIVLPDFFELKENMAVARSECLINVYRRSVERNLDIYKEGKERFVVKFERGFFEFFSRNKKQRLYDMAKSTRRKSYHLVKADFTGRFTNTYTVDEVGYRQKKVEALKRFKHKKEKESELRQNRYRDRIIIDKHKEGLNGRQIMEFLEENYKDDLSNRHINSIIAAWKGGGGFGGDIRR